MKKVILIAGSVILIGISIFFVFGYVFYKVGENVTKLHCINYGRDY